MYTEANKMSKGKRPLLQYQKLLKEVPNWNDHIVKQNCESVCNACSWFSDLLAAVFVSYVKILSSVRLKSETKKISIKLPTNELFVHTCYINAAKDLYKDPYIYDEEMNEHVRDSKLSVRFTLCIESTIKELLPIQQILETYMKQQHGGESVDLNNEEPVEDGDDPDVDENENENEPGPEGEPEPGAEPEPGTESTTAQPEPGGEAGPSPVSEEVKTIPITGQAAQDDGVLFGDAPDEKTKVA
jgi:hypothetical protein